MSVTTLERARPKLLDRVRAWSPTPFTATMAIVATAVAYAAASFFVRRLTDAGVAPVTVASARFAITAAVLGPLVRLDPLRRRATFWGLGSGAAMALGWIAYVRTVETGSVATAGVVYMTYPLFAMVALAAVFGVRPTPRQVAGGCLVVAGAALALGPTGSIPWLALFAPATFGASVAVLTERLHTLDPFERLGSVAVGATAALAPIVLALPADDVVPSSGSEWLWIVGLGVGSALLPMLVYAAAAPHVGAARSAVAGSAELPMVILIGVALGETVTVGHVAGAVVIVAAIVLTTMTRPAHAIPGEAL